MAEAMLGSIPLSAFRGPRDDLETKVAGRNGTYWLRKLKRLLRCDPEREWRLRHNSDDVWLLGQVISPGETANKTPVYHLAQVTWFAIPGILYLSSTAIDSTMARVANTSKVSGPEWTPEQFGNFCDVLGSKKFVRMFDNEGFKGELRLDHNLKQLPGSSDAAYVEIYPFRQLEAQLNFRSDKGLIFDHRLLLAIHTTLRSADGMERLKRLRK